MHVLSVIVVVGLLGGCAFERPDPSKPRVEPYGRVYKEDESRVERWTREQRSCEVGDRDDQRRCPMNPPPE